MQMKIATFFVEIRFLVPVEFLLFRQNVFIKILSLTDIAMWVVFAAIKWKKISCLV